MRLTTILTIPAAALAACASVPAEPGAETSIPYAAGDGIVEWKVVADDALYIRDIGNDWYYVQTSGACPRLRTADSLGFVTTNGQLDRFGTILAQGMRCPLLSVVRSAPPPGDVKG